MKIILSRKGIDSGALSGKMASPILPCGCLCSVPIPYRCGISYSDIHFGTRSFQQIIAELNPRWSNRLAHLDPDLRHGAVTSRLSGWRPAFGQSGAAVGHLINQGVGVGDLFVFFGWFRRTIEQNGNLMFDPRDVHGRHIVFGWLEVGHVIESLPLPKGLLSLSDHPHVKFFEEEDRPNRIYVSSLSGLKAGTFQTEREGIVLTRNGGKRSKWLLPDVFESLFLKRDLSYHGNEERWDREGDMIALQSVSRGQEFVLDGEHHPKIRDYFVSRIRSASAAVLGRYAHQFH
jgi:Nucleotide modification associated domain 3